MIVRPLIGTFEDVADRFRAALHHALHALDFNDVGILEPRHPDQHLDVVARQLRLRHVHFRFDHVLDPERQVLHRDLFLHPVRHAINVAVVVARQMHHGLAHRLARNGACIDTNSTHHLAPLRQRDTLPRLGRLNRRPLPGRP
jgi:hypothetical protein